MTKRHFEAIAGAVRSAPIDEESRLVIASELAGVLVQFNDRFEAGRFIRACMEVTA